MPSLFIIPRNEPSSVSLSIQDKANQPSGTDQARVWIAIGVIAAVIVICACTACLAAAILRRRRMRKEEERAKADDPFMEHKDLGKNRSLTAEDMTGEHERQREIMIHKSLASRSVSRSSRQDVDQVKRAESGHSAGLREDWKEFEARLQRENSGSGHPLAALPDNPASTLSRCPSPSRSPLMPGRLRPDTRRLSQIHPSQR